MVQIEGDVREKVKSLLKELFQFDNQDLDFGIYRIMNFKRKEIAKFIEEDLIKAAEERFKEYALVGMADLQKEVKRLQAEIIRDFGEGTIDDQGNVKKHEDAPKIKEYIDRRKELENAGIIQVQVDDVFNHIYEFFSRYYDKGDFISKRKYGGREKYYVPYDGEEVLFHWANNDQYYVKSGEYFKKYSFKAGVYTVNFVLREAETELNNIKNETRYFILCDDAVFKLDEDKRELDVFLNWRVLSNEERKKYGTRNVQEAIASDTVNELLTEIGDKGVGFELRRKAEEEKTLLEKHVKRYVERNTTDYFIHKNLKIFLDRELDFYLKNEVLDLDEIESMDEKRIRLSKAKMRAIRGISRRIIEFLAQIENLQKILFEKKKFVLKTDYCMTLNLVPEEFYRDIGENEDQVAEWKELFKLDETTQGTLQSTLGKKTLSADFLKSMKHLALDTKFFRQEFKDKLLQSFEDLDGKIEGVLVKSENFQALNLLLEKYRDTVKCIYIDPPYNTGNDEGFAYKDNYQHSTWLAMMENRLKIARKILSKDGLIFQSIDDLELDNSRQLMNECFGRENFVEQMVWKNKFGAGARTKGFIGLHEYVLCYCNDQESFVDIEIPYSKKSQSMYTKKDERFAERGPYGTWPLETTSMAEREHLRYPIVYKGKEIWPKKQWLWSKERAYKALKNDELVITEKNGKFSVRFKQYLYDEKGQMRRGKPLSILEGMYTQEGTKELRDIFGKDIYSFPKPSKLIRSLLNIFINGYPTDKDVLMDFFAGSGTTAHAILNLNKEDGGSRKYILVEMGPYFETVLKPRIQRIMYSKEWKDGRPTSKEGHGHMFKYMYLEQYEDTLHNITFRALDKTIQETLDSFEDYFLRFMLDYETKESPTRLLVDKFHTPFDYKIKTISGNEEKEEPVDLVETFNYLLGLDVEKLRTFKACERTYRVVYGRQNKKSIIVIWRNTKDLNLEKDKRFIEEKVLSGKACDTTFINGDSYVKNATAIEPEFKKLMSA